MPSLSPARPTRAAVAPVAYEASARPAARRAGASRATPRPIDPRTVQGEVVYLLCFAERFGHAGHYVGYTSKLSARLWHHQRGTGARLLAAVAGAHIAVRVARTWQGADRTFERRIHNRKNTRELCPLCSGAAALARARYTPVA